MRIVGVSRGQRFSRVGGLHLGLNITRQVRLCFDQSCRWYGIVHKCDIIGPCQIDRCRRAAISSELQ
jgi:hypothetical protein